MSTVTIKVSRLAKVAMEIFATKYYAETGKHLTNDQVIRELARRADEAIYEQAKIITGENPDNENGDSEEQS